LPDARLQERFMTKTAFILGLPRGMPAAQAAEEAIAAGYPTKVQHVHRIRSAAKRAAKPGSISKGSQKTLAGRPATSTSSKSMLSKSDFIRGQPLSMSAAEVVVAAAKAGLVMTTTLVHTVRGRMRKAAATAPKKPGRPRKTRGVAGTAASTEVTFRKMVLELGLERAKELLDEIQKKLASLIAGR
jgi:hypothetical protein